MKPTAMIRRWFSRTKGAHQSHLLSAIERTGLFDRHRYLALYPEIAASGLDPLLHYVEHGAFEGRSPCQFFDSAYYLARNPDVAATGANPLIHFCEFGWRESRHPCAEFDVDWYLSRHPDSVATNPLAHYLTQGRDLQLEIRPVADPAVEAIRESGLFDADFYFSTYEDLDAAGLDPIAHYLEYGAREGRNPSPMFITRYYLKHNGDVARSGQNPLLHFIGTGWRDLRNPSPEFDVWWYWSMHLNPAAEEVNPLAHYYAKGRELGLATRPERTVSQVAGSGHRHANEPIRRVCLYAGYDADGVVDDYVVDYLRELSRHADIYYLADSEMRPGELDKIAPYTKAAWAERHGEYDFGSYSRLARERVGWNTIEQYDELILANDSCYLLRDLAGVFAKMDGKACDWWGMQATKGIAATHRNPRNRFLEPIPMTSVRASMLDGFERDHTYDFHLGSYFVCYRHPVLRDQQFRKLIDSVVAQESKKNVILKYEIGIGRYLIASGFAFDTFIDHLYPFHPIFSRWYFELLGHGFPFLKRYFLSENHYRVPGLAAWPARVLAHMPEAGIAAIQRNLDRVVDPDRLYENLHVGTERATRDDPVADELLVDVDFLAADQVSPKYPNWWAFPACAFTGRFTGNERALFEEVKNDPSIRKIVLTRELPVQLDGVNVDVVPLESPVGQYLLMRSGNIFIKHSPTRNLVFPVASDLHNIINLWHGIPFKRIGHASLDLQARRRQISREHLKCRAVISSSRIDTLAMTAAFYPLSFADVWPTGLPRNDFIVRAFEQLPHDFQAEINRLEQLVAGRRLVLFMPTFRNSQEDGYYRFSTDEINRLREWLHRHGAVLGVREHMADSARTYGEMLRELDILDLSDAEFPNPEILYRCSSALITDYSSCFIDYMLTGKPAISFAYDYDHYANVERGAFYDLDFVFPGPVSRTFDQLLHAMESLFLPRTDVERAALDWRRRMFFDHVDDQSSARVADRVKRLANISGIGRSDIAIGT